jgi:hypothetical protein
MKAGETYILTTRDHGDSAGVTLHASIRAVRDFDFDAEFRPLLRGPLSDLVETLLNKGLVAIAYDVSVLNLGYHDCFDGNAEAELIRSRI